MRIFYHRQFKKNFKARILNNPRIVKIAKHRTDIFTSDPKNPILRDHSLSGKMSGYRAFSIGGDLRIIYKREGKDVRFYDIGTHNPLPKGL